jgi:predicted amidohydrolase YtcJ
MDAGRLPLRVRFFLRHEEWAAKPALDWTPPSGGDFTIAGVKFFTDGSFGARTAAVGAAYADGHGVGELLWSAAALEGAYRAADAAGLLTATHAIGDRAVALAVGALGASGARRGRVEHVELVDEPTLETLARRDVQLSMQPNFVARWAVPGGLYERALGGARARASNPFRSLLATGRTLAFGSDSMPMGPLFGLRGAMEHPNPAECLSPAEALAAYTRGGPASLGEAAGRLAAGQPADLVVLDARAFTKEAILAARVEATARDGRWLYVAPGSPLATFPVMGPE